MITLKINLLMIHFFQSLAPIFHEMCLYVYIQRNSFFNWMEQHGMSLVLNLTLFYGRKILILP